jgi:hypothetical protein
LILQANATGYLDSCLVYDKLRWFKKQTAITMKRTFIIGGVTFLVGLALGWFRQFRNENNKTRAVAVTALDSSHQAGALAIDDGSTARSEREEAIVPVTIGPKRLAFQFGSLLPQVHLTLISVLQGVVLTVLIQQLDQLTDIALISRAIASFMTIVLVWHLYANAFLTFIWPFLGVHTLLLFAFTAAEIYAFASIHDPLKWLWGLATAAFIGTVIRLLNTTIVAEENYEESKNYDLDVHLEKIAAIHLFLVGIVLLLIGFARDSLVSQNYKYLVQFDIATGLFIVVVTIVLLVLADLSGKRIIESILEESSWELRRFQIIERRRRREQSVRSDL